MGKKKEHNRKYYACNSEQLRARMEDPGKRKAAAVSLYIQVTAPQKIMSA